MTLHHFTNPIWAERRGGWENPEMAGWLARFAAYATRGSGDRVKLWWTINEPTIAPLLSYLFGVHPPRHFGLVAVDRKTLERRPRPTAFVYRDWIAANAI